ncbi:MAG: replication factor C small subunit [Methanobacteriota archaeon]
MEAIWVEKYRPTALDEVLGQDAVTSRLKAYVKSGNLPHLLFAGPAGVGKTTSAIALAKGLYGENWRANFSELNASDERGINVVRTKIKDFARTAPLGADFKILFLDEADALTPDAQAALRRTMERFSGTCRFILSCNYSSKIIDPIQSRCALFRFRPVKDADIEAMLQRISKEEKVKVTKDGVAAILYVAQGDMRKAVNTLQMTASAGATIDEEAVYKTAATARPEEVHEMLRVSLDGGFLKARDLLDDLLLKYGLSGEDIVRQVQRAVFDLPVPDAMKVRLVDRVGEADFRLVEGANERIQLEALLAHVALAGEELKKGR